MSDTISTRNYIDLTNKEENNTSFFFLENLLKARIDLNMETGRYSFDEEMNVYIASLLESVMNRQLSYSEKPYLSPYDFDIKRYIDNHPGHRNEYMVYKENADFGLVSTAVFLEYHHTGSYSKTVLSDLDPKPRIGLYYRMAANALCHLRGTNTTLAQVLTCLGEHIEEMFIIVRKVAGDFFDFMERLSEGTLFHLEKDLQDTFTKNSYMAIVDEFLSQLNDYNNNPCSKKRELLKLYIKRLKSMNANFNFTLPVEEAR